MIGPDYYLIIKSLRSVFINVQGQATVGCGLRSDLSLVFLDSDPVQVEDVVLFAACPAQHKQVLEG